MPGFHNAGKVSHLGQQRHDLRHQLPIPLDRQQPYRHRQLKPPRPQANNTLFVHRK